MKSIFVACFFIVNLFAIPPCEFEKDKVCMYNYIHGLGAEINIINMTHKKVMVQATASLDGTSRQFKDWIIEPNETVKMLEVRYKDWERKPNFGYRSFNYKFID